jgi:DNA-binding SARP family transcriptional activator
MEQELGRQLSQLFSTIIYFHKGGVSKPALIEFFWSESENPSNALKYAIFRLRNKLSKLDDFKDYNWIITKKNGYGFNENLEYIYDIDSFNKLVYENEFSLTKINKAIKLYNGGFLIEIDHMYVYNLRMFYEDLFTQFIIKSTKIFLDKGNFLEVSKIMENVLAMDYLNEEFMLIYLRSLIELKKYNYALEYYKKVSEEYYSLYKKPIGDKVGNLFNDYVESDKYICNDIEDIAKLLKVTKDIKSPIFVKFLVFQKFYELFCRRSQRSHKCISIVLVKLVSENELESKMNILKGIIDQSLRSSDIYCKLGEDEFVFIFTIRDDYDIFTIMSKLQARFFTKCKRDEVKFHFYNRTIDQLQGLGK